MASATSLYPSTSLLPFSSSDSSSSDYVPRPLSISANWIPISCLHDYSNTTYFKHLIRNPLFSNSRNPRVTCWAAEYKFPDPIPEFAEAVSTKWTIPSNFQTVRRQKLEVLVLPFYLFCCLSDSVTCDFFFLFFFFCFLGLFRYLRVLGLTFSIITQ